MNSQYIATLIFRVKTTFNFLSYTMNYFVWIILYTCKSVNAADTVVWADEFNGSNGQLPDPSKWKRDIGGDGWGNQELEYYTDSATNAALDGNGNLVITARRENTANYNCWYGRCQYTSARLLTAGKFSHKYGAFEARIKIPNGKGLWPAFWMLGDDIGQVGWPQCGEIDIMENVEPFTVHGTLHGPGYSAAAGLTSTYRLSNNQPFSNDFHVYRVDWTSSSITFSVDGTTYATKKPSDAPGKKWVFDHAFFMILNFAVGGGWPTNPDESTIFPQTMVVDYVRVYSISDNPIRTGQIKGVGDLCLDVANALTENRTPIQIYNCNGNAAQDWTVQNDGTIRALGKCLDVAGASKENGTPVQLYDCNGTGAQKWALSPAGDIVNINANKCLDIRQPVIPAARMQIWECAGTANQKWKFP